MKIIDIAHISFPEINLPARSGHHLRGYFGTIFQEYSPLLHNHFEDGRLRYAYPLVQYKVLDGVPTLVGVEEGARLLVNLFLQIHELNIFGKTYPVPHKSIELKEIEIGVAPALYNYHFNSLWMALNQENHEIYIKKDETEKQQQLNSILIKNILSFYKGMGLYLAPEERILLTAKTTEKVTKFKGKQMLAFSGTFTTNALLPDLIGLGKSVSRGFGAIRRI